MDDPNVNTMVQMDLQEKRLEPVLRSTYQAKTELVHTATQMSATTKV